MSSIFDNDSSAIAELFLRGHRTAARELDTTLRTLRDMHEGCGDWPRGAAYRDDIVEAAAAIKKTRGRLAGLDPLTLSIAMLGFDPADHRGAAPDSRERPSASGPNRGHGIEAFDTLVAQLEQLERGLRWRAAEEPVRRVGRATRDDVLVFGVDCLVELWKCFRAGERPTQSAKRGGFGHFAEVILTAAPFGFSAGSIRKAVAAALPCDRPAA